MQYKHITVLLKESVDYLNLSDGDSVVDCTLGGGGHTKLLAEAVGEQGKVLAIDHDKQAIKAAEKHLGKLKSRVVFSQGNFKDIDIYLEDHDLGKVNGVLLDLGLSSGQLDNPTRGFSFVNDAKLDMRFDPDKQTLTAHEIIATWSQEQLTEIFRKYGEETLASLIARKIIEQREEESIATTQQLAKLVERIYKKRFHKKSKTHPATKVFQALRIAVNDELASLETVLPKICDALQPGGRVVVISYHSLEDRIVKQFFNLAAKGCICPPDFPKCTCGKDPLMEVITKKPIIPSEEEIEVNPRSRSAKLRIYKKI